MSDSNKLELLATVFSDYICPFCYIGFLRLEKLREDYDLKVNWCMLEIHPENPPEGRPASELDYSPAQWQEMMGNLGEMAREEGITLAGDTCTTNSHKALLLAEAAKDEGKDIFYVLHRRLFAGYLEEGEKIGNVDVLRALAIEAGMSQETIERAWTEPKFNTRLKHTRKAALELGVTSTPTFFIGNQKLVGAISTASLRNAAREVPSP